MTEREIFAANRARGRIALSVSASSGVTRRTHVQEKGSLRVRFPGAPGPTLEAVVVNTAGGVAGGDRFELEFKVGAGADLVVGTVAAEKIYRSDGPDAKMNIKLNVAAGGSLSWMPQELIFFDQARLRRSIDVELAGDASVLVAEAAVLGRTAMGERVESGDFFDRWRVRRDGRLLFGDGLRLDAAIAGQLAEPAIARSNIAFATVLMVPGEEDHVAAVRAVNDQFIGEGGVSAWNGLMLMRLCAPDGAALRHDLMLTLAALRRSAPQLWLT